MTNEAVRGWIITGCIVVTLVVGGGLIGAPLRYAEWVRGIAIVEIKLKVDPVLVEMKSINEKLKEHTILLKEIRDREIGQAKTQR